MQKKHLRILATAACLSAGLAFSAYGEEAISSVPLSFSWDGAPKGGEMVGTLIASTTSKAFIVEGSEYLKMTIPGPTVNGPALRSNFPQQKATIFPDQTAVPSHCPAAMSSTRALRSTVTEVPLSCRSTYPVSAASCQRSLTFPGAAKTLYGTA